MRAERRDIGEFVKTLDASQWELPSPCEGWSVRDVVAHLVAWDDLLLYRTRRQHFVAGARFALLYGTSLGSMRVLNRRLQRRVRSLDPAALKVRFGAEDGPDLKWLFDGTNPGAHLAEYVIHHLDIRRAVGLRHRMQPVRLVGALTGVTQLPGVRVGAWWRLRRFQVQATDVGWAAGRGCVRRMPGETALMWLAGRSDVT